MNTRILLVAPALALVAAASPAIARNDSAHRVTEQMRNPVTQQAMAHAIAAMSEAMLDMPLEPFARMADAMGDHRTAREMHGATVGDYAGPEARDMPREMSRKVPAMMGAMGGMAAAAEEMAPALKAMAREMGARMTEAMRDGVSGPDRDYRTGRSDSERREADRRDADRHDDGPPPNAQDEGDAPH